MLKIYELSKEGIEYFNKHYSMHINFIDYMKVNGIEIKKTYTFLPSDFNSPYSLNEFKHGKRIDEHTQIFKRENSIFSSDILKFLTLKGVLAEFIEKYMETRKKSVVYFSEFIHTKTTLKSDIEKCEIKTEENNNKIFIEEQILYYITCNRADKYEILANLIYSQGLWLPYEVGFISNYVPKNEIATKDEINRIFEGVCLVFAGSYDGEGVIVGEVNEGEFIKTFNELEIDYTLDDKV